MTNIELQFYSKVPYHLAKISESLDELVELLEDGRQTKGRHSAKSVVDK